MYEPQTGEGVHGWRRGASAAASTGAGPFAGEERTRWSMAASPALGYVGLGTIGRPVATRLAATGAPLFVFDPDPEALAGLAGDVTACGSAAEVARR